MIAFRPNEGPQTEFLAAPEQEVLYGGAAGGGKVLLDYQSVLTPKGFKSCFDIKVGDVICDPKGGTQIITHIHPWQENKKWEIEFDDGTVYDTVEGHLWYYWLSRNGESRAVVRTTKQMLEHKVKTNRTPIIPTTQSVEINSAPYLANLTPYTLGVLVGDGCLVNKSISLTCHDNDWPFLSKELGFPDSDLKRSGFTVRFIGQSRANLVSALEDYELIGKKSESKFIPDSYLWNSEWVRLEVLRGLMDTDGFRDPTRARAEFSTVSKQLAENVVFLARSLGYRVSCYEKIGSYGNSSGDKVLCKKVYRLYITGYDIDNIFKLPRKKTGVLGKQTGRRVIDIRKTSEKVRGRCITVSSDHSLYISDDFVVTHNSYAMLADPLHQIQHGAFSGLLLRRTNDELRELKQKSRDLYSKIFGPDITWQARLDSYVHRNGGRLWMTYLDKDDDVLRYQGQSFNWIGFDELTQWPTPYAWDYLRSRLRTTSPKLKTYQRGTTNPGGPGAWWVKKMFIDPAPWGDSFWATDIETGETMVEPESNPDGTPNEYGGQPLFKRRFIPAKLTDNPFLTRDRTYMRNLMGLPEMKRKQLLEGNWDALEGMAFPEWNREIHVIDPFNIPRSWRKFRSCDYGYGSYSGVVWFAIHPSGQLIVYRDLEVSRVYPEDLADLVYEIERQAGDNVSYGVVDGSIFAQRGDRGPSRGDRLNKWKGFQRWADRSQGSRVSGKDLLHKLLDIPEGEDEPGIMFFSTATNCISQIPMLPLDKNNPDDVDTKSRDHIYDALRYGIMSRPIPVTLEQEFGSFAGYTNSWSPSEPTFGY